MRYIEDDAPNEVFTSNLQIALREVCKVHGVSLPKALAMLRKSSIDNPVRGRGCILYME